MTARTWIVFALLLLLGVVAAVLLFRDRWQRVQADIDRQLAQRDADRADAIAALLADVNVPFAAIANGLPDVDGAYYSIAIGGASVATYDYEEPTR